MSRFESRGSRPPYRNHLVAHDDPADSPGRSRLTRNNLTAGYLAQQSLWARRRVDDGKRHRFGSGIERGMINVCGNIDARTRTDFYRRSVVYHLFAFARYDVNDLLRAGMIMSLVTFPCSEFNDPETEANGSGHPGFAEEVDFSPVEFETINVLSGSNDAGSKFMHSSWG
jgi:hypothetical protein